MQDIIVYDIEIAEEVCNIPGEWGNPFGMGLGSVVLYSYNEDKYYEYLHNSSREEIQSKLNGNRIITFNGLTFDSKVLLGNDRILESGSSDINVRVSSADRKISWFEFDILRHCLGVISSKNCLLETINLRSRGGNKLDDFAENTLGNEFKKTGHGSDAPKLYKDGKYDELLSYNKQDVFITKLLYEHIKNKGYLVNGFGTTLTFDFKRRGN